MANMMILYAVSLFLFLTVVTADIPKYADCGSVKGSVKSVTMSVKCDADKCYLVKGKNVTIHVKFVPNEIVSASTAEVKGYLGPVGIKFALPNPNGCKDSGLACPLKSGASVEYISNIFVKRSYPDIKVVVHWTLFDQSKAIIWCVAIPVELVSS